MSNILSFPTDRIRPAPAAAGAALPAPAWQPATRGEILLFTGVRYMRHPLTERQADKPPSSGGRGR
ncbi:MAG: hypothetical protein BroJett030_32170 [Alphaproteobacteria bacterium]|nr:MAG: hypothetical protein BroJett030_32170 [Alphaproteobacteria bacterium]